MPKWKARFTGDKYHLEMLAEEFHSDEFSFFQEEGEEFYLKHSKFESLNSAELINDYANEFIKYVNNSMSLIINENVNTLLHSVVETDCDGRKKHYVNLACQIIITSRCSATVTVINEDGENVQKSKKLSDMYVLILAAQHDSRVAEVLEFYKDGSWSDLYKVFELIRDEIEKNEVVEKGWLTKSELSRFTQTAQSKKAIGKDARHASKKYLPPIEPMTLSEAKRMIKGLVIAWIKNKQ